METSKSKLNTSNLPWLEALSNPETYPHAVDNIEIIHTHLSVVALTGVFAYKFKKPEDYGFADFSTLERRQQFCERELVLNRRTAPELYLEVVELVHENNSWRLVERTQDRFENCASPNEFALKMKQFNTSTQLDMLAQHEGLSDELLDLLTDQIMELHKRAKLASPEMTASAPDRLEYAIRNNFKPLPQSDRYEKLKGQFNALLQQHRKFLEARAQEGCIRDCHGDLHLKNICLWNGKPLLFDCIEFNDDYRVIDVLADVAFLYMDLTYRNLKYAAHRVLSKYLSGTGDYAGLRCWPLWVAYRAQVRAKVAQLTIGSSGVTKVEAQVAQEELDQYTSLAETFLKTRQGKIVMMVGLPGSGKSTVGLKIACAEDGVLIRSDVERKRLHASGSEEVLYGSELSVKTYEILQQHVRAVVAGGLTAVLDATYLKRDHRRSVIDLASRMGIELQMVHCEVPMSVLRERVRKRAKEGTDVSDADEAVLEQLASAWEPFTEDEQRFLTKGKFSWNP